MHNRVHFYLPPTFIGMEKKTFRGDRSYIKSLCYFDGDMISINEKKKTNTLYKAWKLKLNIYNRLRLYHAEAVKKKKKEEEDALSFWNFIEM